VASAAAVAIGPAVASGAVAPPRYEMPEIRIDPLTGLRAIVAGERAHRPGGGLSAEPAPAVDPENDPFAEGHEDRTPPEVYAVRPGGGPPDTPGWTVRVVPNMYPALSADSPAPEPDAKPDLFWAGPARGAHEVIVNAPDTVSSLSDLTPDQVVGAVDVWRERMRAHGDAPYVHLIVNERKEAGASLQHTHAQLYALDFVPAAIARERERFGAYATRTMGGNLLGDLVQEEVRRRERIVAIDDETVLMAPYGARVPFQLLIAPRRPRERFEDDGPTGARMLHEALGRLARRLGASPPLNLWVRTAPSGSDHFCWRIDILPRLVHLAGLELGAGVHLNIVAPEQAASELRDS
jgi:UDPglucose--hexose-1-phosphate uridylyltransferase